jgi:DNA-binding CsgD family transcriptional regulator
MRGLRSRSRLLEREGELAKLSELVGSARDARGAVALVEGPPGIGKTELLGALGGLARKAGLELLRARGSEHEQGFAFGVARQLFEAPVASAAEPEREELLSGAAALAGPLVDPSRVPDQAPHPGGDPFPLLHGLYWLTANLAERTPLAIVVDDAHWADGPSLRFLHYLSRRLEGVPALLALAARSTSPEAPVEPIDAIKAEGSCALVHPGALSEPATATLLAELLEASPAPELTREAHRATGGNPFLLSELGRSLAADGVVPDAAAAAHVKRARPETISRSALTRLARLPPAARELARAAALLGEDAELRHAAALAELGQDEALAAADRLVGAGLFQPGPQLRFAHPVILQALYADLPAGERARRHKVAARLLAAEPGAPERAAAHLIETAPAAEGWVVEALGEAAAAAIATGAPEIAASYLRRALAEPPTADARAGVLFALGQAEAQTLDPRAFAHLEGAASASSDPLQRAMAFGVLSNTLQTQGDYVAAFSTAREALEQIPPGTGGEGEAWLLGSACWAGRAVPELVDEVTALLQQQRTGPAGQPTHAELPRVLYGAFDALLRGERHLFADRLDWVATQPFELSDATLVPFFWVLGIVQAFLGLDREAEATLGRALEQARRRGDKVYIGHSLGHLAYLRWRRGDLAGGIAEAETVLDLAAQPSEQWDPGTTFALVMRALCLAERGDLAAAASALELPEGLEGRLAGTWWWPWLLYGRGRVALARGEWAEARTQSLAAGERMLAIQAPSPDYMPWRSLAAQALAREGERERALTLAREELERARKEGSQRATGIALTALGTIEGGEAGLKALAEAVDELAGRPDRLEHARALCEHGAALRRANRRADAREPLKSAIELARACGATPLTQRAHAELRATGARPRSLTFTGIESLTARERQVAELAAEGRSNPEIAQELFVTRNTIETHLRSVYRKLELDSRTQLAAALAAERG